ncbi:hypothetical protein PBI_GAIA_87 [Mycobacterium phage Gaia]|uniref:Uncharacterized protein n=1 Tax=Mycobacterium phage Gaia TaxID=1486472 RepID=A0A068F4M4_9CAUD|nr:tail fiber protein [Mycobacterium phage Gaia]AID58906.1 hypothetical protein PBI_GAIA_87 [Mycobacterium phage Gaia]AYR00024.1 hypothetical protein PBI_NEBKISS_86 [Mycobacterium phage Nebkiss]
MTDVLVDPIAELGEQFSDDIPCGGNIFPLLRDCPDQAPAVFISVHASCDAADPQDLKCADCYAIWLRAHKDKGTLFISCTCRVRMRPEDCYRPI